jgi:YggT family protein
MNTVLAITRGDVADYVSVLITVYVVLIFIRILMSWFPRIPYHPVLKAVLNFVEETTNPYLNLFRKFIPMVRIGPGAIDLSPIVAVLVLFIVRALLVAVIRG